jgi:hypothetical protein
LARAQELGIATYQVDGAVEAVPAAQKAVQSKSRAAGRGTLTDLRQWLAFQDHSLLEPSFNERKAARAILAATPAVLQGLTAGLSASQWRHEPTPEDWAIIELVCHLRDTEMEVHHDQIRTLLEEPQPFVPRPDAAVWAKQRNYLDEDGKRALSSFASARLQTLAILDALSDDVWGRSARHAIFGPTNFTEVVGFMADHDRLHIQQAWQTLQALG